MDKKIVIALLIGFFVAMSYGSEAPKGYFQQKKTVAALHTLALLKHQTLPALGQRIKQVITKKTNDKVAREMMLIVQAFIVKFKVCLIENQAQAALCIHEKLKSNIDLLIAAFNVSQPDLIGQLTLLIWKNSSMFFHESVHYDLADALHQCITNYFIPQEQEHRKMEKEKMIQALMKMNGISRESAIALMESELKIADAKKQIASTDVKEREHAEVTQSRVQGDSKEALETIQPKKKEEKKESCSVVQPKPKADQKKLMVNKAKVLQQSISTNRNPISLTKIFREARSIKPLIHRTGAYTERVYRRPWH